MIFVVGLALVLVDVLGPSQAPVPETVSPLPDLSEQRQRVVKIVTPGEVGAGLVLGTDGDHVVIATALHVVRGAPANRVTTSTAGSGDACPEVAGITLAFPGGRDVFSGAVPVACRGDVDLAILDLTAPGVARAFSEQPMLCWQEPRDQERVHLIGHAIEDWKVTSGDKVLDPYFEGDIRRFRLSGQGSGQGSSGGPVLNDAGCLIGLLTHHAATASRATRTTGVLQLAKLYRLSTNLIGGTDGPDRLARQRIFTDVSETLNNYLFQMEAVRAFFHRQKLRGVEIGQITTEYNAAFQKWYQRRTALSEAIGSQWGRARAADFDRTTDKLYTLHNRIVYNQLADITASLIANGKLSKDELKTLNTVLPQLDAQLQEAGPMVADLLDRMKPLLSNGQ